MINRTLFRKKKQKYRKEKNKKYRSDINKFKI